MHKQTSEAPKGTLAKKASSPNPIVIISCIILVSALASYVVPAGVFDRVVDANTGRSVVDPSTFHYVEQNPTGFFDLFKSLTLGLQKASDIIAFLLIIGGAFGVMEATGAIKSAMGTLVLKMRGKELLLIPVCMFIFSCGSAFAANEEEYLAFLPLILSICLAMGFDSLTALGIVFGSTGAGIASGCTNAFTVGVAQGIAGLPMFSGIQLRLVILLVLYVINVTFVTLHARKVRANPQSSSMYEMDRARTDILAVDVEERLTGRHKLVLLLFVVTVAALIYGVINYGFYIDELAALFLIMGVAAGIVGGLRPGEIADSFVKGSHNMLFPCIMVGFCKATTVILTDALIMDSIIHFLASLLNGIPAAFTACGMFLIQAVFNLLVPSGSGQAAITMPIMAPLADLLHITRQTAVLAFQLGDASTNCITPASGMTMSALAIAGVPLNKWWKFFVPLVLIWWGVSMLFLVFATSIGYGPF